MASRAARKIVRAITTVNRVIATIAVKTKTVAIIMANRAIAIIGAKAKTAAIMANRAIVRARTVAMITSAKVASL